MTAHRIGVFDSGVGGAIMTEYLQQRFPDWEFIFRDDQAHAPYGEKTVAEIHQLANQMVQGLLQENVEAIVVACHTISSTCFAAVAQDSPVPLLSVNDALMQALVSLPANQHVGLLATTATINSQWFPHQLQLAQPQAQLTAVACPQLATAIDAHNEAWIDQLLTQYLAQLPLESLTTLALGCTHYPAVIPQLRAQVPARVTIVDARPGIATKLANLFAS